MSELTNQILNLKQGDHLCLFYEKDPAEQMPALVPFIQEALTNDEQFIYIADDQTVEQLRARLQSSGINADGESRASRLKLWTRNEWRQPGELSSQRKALQVREFIAESAAAGFKGIRFAVEMTWTMGPDIHARELEHWEATINTIFTPQYPGRIICQYNQSRLAPEALIAGLHTHPLAIIGNEVCPNPFYQAPLILNGHTNGNGNGHHSDTAIRARAHWMIGQIKQARLAQKQREELICKETALKEQRKRAKELSMLLETAAMGLHWVAEDGKIIWANKAEMDMLGYSSKEYIGRHIAEFHTNRQAVEDILHRLNRGEQLRQYEARLRGKNGSIKNVLIDSSGLWDNGRLVHTQCFTRDVTEQKRAEQELRTQRERLEAIVRNSPGCVKIVAPDGALLQMNPAGLCIIEAGSPEEAVGKNIFDLIAPEHRDAFRAMHERVCAGQNEQLEFEVIGLRGTRRWMFTHATPIQEPGTGRLLHLSITHDITKRKATEDALRESELRFRTMAEALPNLVWTDLPDGTCDWLGSQWEQYTGIRVNELLGLNWLHKVIHPDDRERTLARWKAACADHADYDTEFRIRRYDGEYRWFKTRGVPVRDDSGKIVYWFGTCTDIQDVKDAERRERALIERNLLATAKFEAVFNQSGIFAGITDLEGNLIEVNEIAVNSSGYTRAAVLNKPLWETPWWRGSEEVKNRIRQATCQAIAGNVFRDTLRYWTADGSERVVDFALHPIRDESGVVRFLHPTGIDVTERKRVEQALQLSEERFRLAAFSDAITLYEQDADLRYTWLYPLHPEHEHSLGRTDLELLPNHHGEDLSRWKREVMTTGLPQRREVETGHAMGNRTYDVFILPKRNSAGTIVGVAGTALDITRRKEAERTLRDVEERFRSILANSPTVIFIKDTEGRYLQVNRWYEELFHRSENEIRGKTDFDLFPPAVARTFRENDLIVTRTGKPLEVEETAPHDDGLHTYISIKFPLRRQDGTIYAIAGISTDITDRKVAEMAARRLAAIVETSDDAIVSKDLQGVISSWNEGAERIFGYTAQEMIGRPIMTLIPANRQNEEADILARLRRGERIAHFETIRQRKDGSLVEISLTISPIKDASGKIVGASKIARDISERRQTERQEQALYDLVTSINRASTNREIYDAALDAVCRCHNADRASVLIKEPDGVMRFKAWRHLSDDYRAAVEGHSPWKPDDTDPQPICIPDVRKADLAERLLEVIEREGIRALAFIPICHEDRLLGKFMLYYNAPHSFSPPQIRLAQTISIQIGFALERQQSGEALERLVNERTASLREAIAQMEEFSYTVSHDLRAPVRAMHGYAKVLLEDHGDSLNPQAREFLDRIVRGGARMDRLIQDVLTYSRLSRREFTVQPVDLDKLVRELLHQYAEIQTARGEVAVVGTLHSVVAHEASLTQAISNLINNAFKFVNPGTLPRVRIRTQRINGEVRLMIEDNGIGIRPEHQHRLFGMFERVHPERGYEGTGIGLAIVRKAVERMGGKVDVESDGLTGSNFWIQLPASK